MVDFIYKGLLELRGAWVERELQNEKFLPTVGFEPGIVLLRSIGANHCITKSEIYWAC